MTGTTETPAAETAAPTKPQPTPLEKFQEWGYRHIPDNPYGEGLVLSPGGQRRFAHTLGWISGLAMGSDESKAMVAELAVSLDETMRLLATFGGQASIPVDGGQQTVSAPQYRVMLGDDGTFGGFTLSYYVAIPDEKRQALAESIDNAAFQSADLEWAVARCRRDAAYAETDKQLSIRKELETSRYFNPVWAQQAKAKAESTHLLEHGPHADKYAASSIYGCERCKPARDRLQYSGGFVRIHYGYSFNGGMLLHGLGIQNFSVEIGGGNRPHWSRHH